MSYTRGESAPSRCPTGPSGEKLCKCGCGRPVPKGRLSWHGKDCVEEWKIRNQPQHARQRVWMRDRGVCAECGVDAEQAERRFHITSVWEWVRKHDRVGSWHRRHSWMTPCPEFLHPKNDRFQWHSPRVQAAIKKRIDRIVADGWSLLRTSWWQADHIVPVVEGGGQCGIANLRTLCERCHRRATAALRKRLKQLKEP